VFTICCVQVFMALWSVNLLYILIFIWVPLCGYWGARWFSNCPLAVYAAYVTLEVAARIALAVHPGTRYYHDGKSTSAEDEALRVVSIIGAVFMVRPLRLTSTLALCPC
jgi:hypothetical protein